MARRFVIRNIKTDEYLCEKFFAGYFFNADITSAIKTKDEQSARNKMMSQNIVGTSLLQIVPIDIN